MNQIKDMRKIRSKQYLSNALIDLMQEKDFEKITVNDIVNKACVSRSTFYFQFEDKYFFLNSIIDEILADLRQETKVDSQNISEIEGRSHKYYEKHFMYIYKHAHFFKTMLGKHGTPLFRKKFEESAYITYRDIFLEYPVVNCGESLDYFIQYIISAHIGVTIKWIDAGLQESPAFMADLLTKLTFHGLLHGLEMDHDIQLPH
jgi:AcrR family transcriptional regulator